LGERKVEERRSLSYNKIPPLLRKERGIKGERIIKQKVRIL